jgi:hypothetical protein
MTKKDISKYYADEQVVRIIAGLVFIIMLLSLLNHWMFPLYVLLADFALRAFTYQPAPLAAISKLIARRLHLKPRPIFAAPKKFAAAMGFVFTLSVLVFFLIKLELAAYVAGSILLACAFLESVVSVCAGCYVYDWLVAPLVNKKNNSGLPNQKH